MKKQRISPVLNEESQLASSISTLKMKDLPVADRPYEKLEHNGESSLTDTELLAILLKSGIKGVPAITLAQKILKMDFQKQGISFLSQIPIEDLKIIPGVGRIKSIQIKAGVELGRRISRVTNQGNETIINTSADIVKYIQEEMQLLTCEELRIALLDNKNALIKIIKSTCGSVKTTMFSPREIFKDAIKYNAASMILIHNHPSGNPHPSQSDLKTTIALSKIAKELDIPIIDHIIIGKNRYESIQAIINKEKEQQC
ncbi:MAG: RadC family protein [Saccharofermentanales bacterium]